MAEYEGPEGTALAAARLAGAPPAAVNPAVLPPGEAAEPPVDLSLLTPEVGRLLVGHVTTPGMVVLAVTEGDHTEHVRIGADPARPTVETGPAGGPADPAIWRDARADQLLDALEAILPRGGSTGDAFIAAPHLTEAAPERSLELTEPQARQARKLLEEGLSPAEVFSSLEGLDPALRDALLATGPRVALSVVLNDPYGTVAEQPVPWARVWVHGELGLYRTDPAGPGTEGPALPRITAVAPGDVLGTAVPILQEAMRFTSEVQRAALARSGGAR